MLWRILVSGFLLGILLLIPTSAYNRLDPLLFAGSGRCLRFLLFFADYLLIGHDILKKAFLGILNRRLFDENFLMAIATIGAMLLATFENGEYTEAIAVMLFYQIGEFFQSYAVGKSRRNISALMDIRPDYANIEKEGKLVRVAPDEIELGSIITVLPGEKIPLDGVVIEGCASLDTGALTGESLPRPVAIGDTVISGCISSNGLLKIKTTKEFEESTVSKILELVENASSRKSSSENFISKFAKYYTPVVCGCALALATLPPIFGMVLGGVGANFGIWLYRALTFLVISCPCALVVSIPLGFFAGIGGAGHEGILIKGSHFLESLSRARCVMLDKTGTLTEGRFRVQGVYHNAIEENKLIEYAALAEASSTHPIAKSLCEAFGGPIDRSRAGEIIEHSGMGLTAIVDGKIIAVGNDKLMKKLGIGHKECIAVGSVVHVAIDGVYTGSILIADAVKPSAKAALVSLKKAGVKKTVMLAGDNEATAREVASILSVDEYHSSLLPADKVEWVEQYVSSQKNGTLVFAGDGINDAPVLARADIGIAMGAMGSDAAIEAADVVLMDDDPIKIAKAIRISRKCMSIVKQNIIFALAVKFICLALGAFGYTNMYLAIFADVGVMVLAVLNAIRCLFVKNI